MGSPALQADSLPAELPGKPMYRYTSRFCFGCWIHKYLLYDERRKERGRKKGRKEGRKEGRKRKEREKEKKVTDGAIMRVYQALGTVIKPISCTWIS